MSHANPAVVLTAIKARRGQGKDPTTDMGLVAVQFCAPHIRNILQLRLAFVFRFQLGPRLRPEVILRCMEHTENPEAPLRNAQMLTRVCPCDWEGRLTPNTLGLRGKVTAQM